MNELLLIFAGVMLIALRVDITRLLPAVVRLRTVHAIGI
jgi:hypothetical protein